VEKRGVVVKKEGKVVVAEYVAAELNLESIGYFSAGYNRKYPDQERKSKLVLLNNDRLVKIIPNVEYGFPNCIDLDYYRAFLKICDERVKLVHRTKDGKVTMHPHLPVPIGFHSREIIRKAGREWGGRDLQSVREWIKRSTSTVIEGGVYRARTKGIDTEFGGPLFTQFVLVGDQLRNGAVAEMNYIWPAPWFLSNFYYRYTRPVDLAFHQRLKTPIAKTLYPILDSGWYAAQGSAYAKRYEDLCSILYIEPQKHLSRVQQQLDPAHEDLKREQFVESWEYGRDEHGNWSGVIRWLPGAKWFQDQESRQARKVFLSSQDNENLSPVALEGREQIEEAQTKDAFEHQPVVLTHRDRVKNFFANQGQLKISQRKIEKEERILAAMEQEGFSHAEIDQGIAWLLKNRQKFGGDVNSLRLLTETIGQALRTDEGGKKTRNVIRGLPPLQVDEARALKEQQWEERFQAFSPETQDGLREEAIANLINEGHKPEIVRELKTLVKTEIFRIMATRSTPSAETIS
jgi:hypothetical protein